MTGSDSRRCPRSSCCASALSVPHSGAAPTSDVLREQLVDEGLIAQAPPLGFPPHGPKDLGIDPNGDQPSGSDPQGGAPHAAHCSELHGRCLGEIGEVNPAPPHMPSVLSGSPGAR